MTINKIILLTGPDEAPVLTRMLLRANGSLAVRPVHDPARLEAEIAPGARLISFCSGVIVPASLLARLEGPGYNFHPGPPERPGRYPSVFALFDNAADFGITVHEMAPQVDSGPIVMTERFAIPADSDLRALENLTLTKLAESFKRMAPYFANVARPLPHLPIAWTGRRTRRADYEALRIITPEMDAREIARRERCCGSVG